MPKSIAPIEDMKLIVSNPFALLITKKIIVNIPKDVNPTPSIMYLGSVL